MKRAVSPIPQKGSGRYQRASTVRTDQAIGRQMKLPKSQQERQDLVKRRKLPKSRRATTGASGTQDRRGDRRRPPACGPQHSGDDPENRTASALERATASSGPPIGSRGGRSCLRQAFFPSTWSPPSRCRPVSRWTCQNREQRILRDFCHQPRPLVFSGSTAARESPPTRRFHRFSKMYGNMPDSVADEPV